MRKQTRQEILAGFYLGYWSYFVDIDCRDAGYLTAGKVKNNFST